MNFLLLLAYDGTNYCGFQVQPNGRSVAQTFQDGLEAVLGTRPDIKGCSRTDAGVHALGFALNFHADTRIPPEKLPLALNQHLPPDIRVLSARIVPEDFHARYAAHTKTYLYRIHNSPIDSPFDAKYYTRVPRRLDETKMQQAARLFVGKHDFLALCAAGSSAAAHGDTVRTITDCNVVRKGDELEITVTADGYLYNMVRILAGTLCEAGAGRLDPDAVQQQMLRQAMQTFDRHMAQGGYYEGLLSDGNLASMRMNTLENNQLDDLCLLLPEQDRLVLRGGCSSPAGSGWRQLDVEIPLQAADPQPQTVLTDTYGSASVQLEGTQGTITLRRTPETAAWDADYGIRLEQDRTYPILGIYNEYIDLCIGELGASFHPVVYLLTKDGVVEYVDVLHCLMFGSALVCQDPIYIANQGVALERSGKEVILHQEDGSVLELAPLTAEWNAQELPSEAVGAFNDMSDDQFDWMDVESSGSVQMGVQDNSVFYQGYADYLGVVPEGMVLAIFTDTGLDFVAAFKMDLYDNLTMTMIDGQNPFAEGETQLQMTRSYD